MAKSTTSKGRTVTRTSPTSRTITRPAGKVKAVPGARARSRAAARPTAARLPAARAAKPKPAAQPAPDAPPTAPTERNQHRTQLQHERTHVQQQLDTIKDLPQYAVEAKAKATRLEEIDAEIAALL
jgi:hypothetical protein